MPKPKKPLEQEPELTLETSEQLNARLDGSAETVSSVELTEGIANAETELTASVSRLQGNITKPQEAPTKESYQELRERIQKGWETTKLLATGAFAGLFGAQAVEMSMLIKNASAMDDFKAGIISDPKLYEHAMNAMQTLEPALQGTMALTAAVPLLLVGYRMIASMLRERNYYKPATA